MTGIPNARSSVEAGSATATVKPIAFAAPPRRANRGPETGLPGLVREPCAGQQ
jgi:hypothetical protein